MQEFVENANGASGMGAHARGSGMSSFEGLSGFRDDTGNATADDIIPSEKFGVGKDMSQITGVASTQRDTSKNEPVHQMMERVMGKTSGENETGRNEYLLDK